MAFEWIVVNGSAMDRRTIAVCAVCMDWRYIGELVEAGGRDGNPEFSKTS